MMNNQEQNQVRAMSLIGRTMNIQPKDQTKIIKNVRLIDVKAPNVVFQYESGDKQGETFELEANSFLWEALNSKEEGEIWHHESTKNQLLEAYGDEVPDRVRDFVAEHIDKPLKELYAIVEARSKEQ